MGFSSFFSPLPFFAPIGIRPIVSLMSKKSALRGEGRGLRRGGRIRGIYEGREEGGEGDDFERCRPGGSFDWKVLPPSLPLSFPPFSAFEFYSCRRI